MLWPSMELVLQIVRLPAITIHGLLNLGGTNRLLFNAVSNGIVDI